MKYWIEIVSASEDMYCKTCGSKIYPNEVGHVGVAVPTLVEDSTQSVPILQNTAICNKCWNQGVR